MHHAFIHSLKLHASTQARGKRRAVRLGKKDIHVSGTPQLLVQRELAPQIPSPPANLHRQPGRTRQFVVQHSHSHHVAPRRRIPIPLLQPRHPEPVAYPDNRYLPWQKQLSFRELEPREIHHFPLPVKAITISRVKQILRQFTFPFRHQPPHLWRNLLGILLVKPLYCRKPSHRLFLLRATAHFLPLPFFPRDSTSPHAQTPTSFVIYHVSTLSDHNTIKNIFYYHNK